MAIIFCLIFYITHSNWPIIMYCYCLFLIPIKASFFSSKVYVLEYVERKQYQWISSKESMDLATNKQFQTNQNANRSCLGTRIPWIACDGDCRERRGRCSKGQSGSLGCPGDTKQQHWISLIGPSWNLPIKAFPIIPNRPGGSAGEGISPACSKKRRLIRCHSKKKN